MRGKRGPCWPAAIAFLFTLAAGTLALAPASATEDGPAAKDGDSKTGSTRVQDLPKPIPEVMDKLQEVGNEVGKGISKAASEGAKAVNKAVKGQKEQAKDK